MTRKSQALVVFAAVAALAATVGAGSASAGEIVAARTGPVRIEMPGPPKSAVGAHSFTFARSLDYCGPMGTTEEVRLREVPVSALVPHPSAVITVIVSFPAYEPPEVCPPIPYSVETLRVKTKRPAASLQFFDGSYEPPRRIWPRPEDGGTRWAGPSIAP